MRILVYPHDLGMGGSQLNAIELAAGVRDLGHSVAIYGRPGPLCDRIEDLGLEFIASPPPHRRPSWGVIRDLRARIVDRDIDIVHGYEWPPALEAALAARGRAAGTAVATVMSMSVAPFIPRTMALQVGTEQIAAGERSRGRLRVEVMEPPVDLEHNVPPSPEALQDFRTRWGLTRDTLTVVCVGRLAHQLKSEGVHSAVWAVGELASRWPIRLLLVGDGPARERISAAASDVNHRHGRDVVTVTGEILDPRAAYACADVVIGMGGSALRALAFRKPLIVQGEKGYFRLLEPGTADEFLWQGWYGVGSAPENGSPALAAILESLLRHQERAELLGEFGHDLVARRYSLESAARRQVIAYEQAARTRPGSAERVLDLARGSVEFGRHHARRRVLRLAGVRPADDFNARPVAAGTRGRRSIRDEALVVYLPGTSWTGVAGTDRRLATELATDRDVLWVDPPVSPMSLQRDRRAGQAVDPVGLTLVAPGIWRLRVLSPPGFTRGGVRQIARLQVQRAVRQSVRHLGLPVHGVVLSSASGRFPSAVPGRKLYFVTDDWPEAAGMMGLARHAVASDQRRNLRDADAVAAVSPALATDLQARSPRPVVVHVVPNGCIPPAEPGLTEYPGASGPHRFAGVIGQLNERLDVDVLDAVVAAGVDLLVVGPRTERDPGTRDRLDRFLNQPGVRWVGRQPAAAVPRYLAQMAVGLTPYAASAFNRASFPLKTLEYLAAGLRVISTDLPASRWLATDLIDIASGPEEFARAVLARMAARDRHADAVRAREFARRHSWRSRADDLMSLLGGSPMR